MKILAVFDEKNYRNTVATYEKYSVRGIIMRDGKLAMQCSKEGEYKILGGGLEKGESYEEALMREILEETGFHVKPESIKELGEIQEIRRDIFEADKKYICHSLFYQCEVEGEQEELRLTRSEIEKGYVVKWAEPQEIYNTNILIEKDPWIIRDTAFVKMIMDHQIKLSEGNLS